MAASFTTSAQQKPPSPSPTSTTDTSWFRPPPVSTHRAHTSATLSSDSQATSRSTSLSSLSSHSFPNSPRLHINVNLPSSDASTGYGAIGDKVNVQRRGFGWDRGGRSVLYSDKEEEHGMEVLGDMPHTPPMIADLLDPTGLTPIAPKRIRTPSLPILRSQKTNRIDMNPGFDHPGMISSYDQPLLSQFDRLAVTSYPYTPPSTVDSFPSPQSAQYPFPPGPFDAVPTTPTRQPVLRNHQSVPNLDRVERRRGSVRFLDELESHGGNDYASMGGMKSRSMSNLGAPGLSKKRNVYFHSLPPQITEHGLRAFAEVFGKVHSMRVAAEDTRGSGGRYEGRRHAFIAFEASDQAGAFMAAIRDQDISCEYAKEDWQTEYKAREDTTSSNVYIVGLPLNWGKDEVEDYMTQFGRVASLRLLEDKEGNRRGPVLVRFDSRPQAERAIKILNGQVHPSTGERLQARIADSDGQKDFKKLRSTSADLILDDRTHHIAMPEDSDNLTYLLAIRDKYAQRLQLLDAQISAAESRYQAPSYECESQHTSPLPPPAWRQRHISGIDAYTPWNGVPPPATPRQHYPAFAFGSQNDSFGNSYDRSPALDQTFAHKPLYPDLLAPTGLHHPQSTPELNSGRSSAAGTAKLLWPN